MSSEQQKSYVLRRLYTATILCGTFLVIEVTGGYLAGSLAVMSDAAHLFADLTAFGVSIGAAHLAALPSSAQHTYGLKRLESLAALISMLSLALVSLWLAVAAVRRFLGVLSISLSQNNNNEEMMEDAVVVDGRLMSGIAAIGVGVNVCLAFVLGPELHVHLPGSSHNHDHSSHEHAHQSYDSNNHNHSHDHHHNSSAAAACEDGEGGNGERAAVDNGDSAIVNETSPLLVSHNHSHQHQHQHHYTVHHDDEVPPDEEEEEEENCREGEREVLVVDEEQQCHYHQDKKKAATPHHIPRRNVNLHAAYIHVLGDLLQSVAVLLAGLVIWWKPTWHVVDPVITLLFCGIVFYSTLSVIRHSMAVLLEEVPPHIRWHDVHRAIDSVPHIQQTHDLHIWSISDGVPALSVHCFVDTDVVNTKAVLSDVYDVCRAAGIHHATIQIQTGAVGECITCQEDDDDDEHDHSHNHDHAGGCASSSGRGGGGRQQQQCASPRLSFVQ